MTDPIARLNAALEGRYRVERHLGEGGMATVYLAQDIKLARPVAIKVLAEGLAYRTEDRSRFIREAQTVAGLSHSQIVPVYDVGNSEDLVWFVMAHVDGENLREKVEREGPQPLHVVRLLLQDVAQGLAYAHSHEVIHRDIKPGNILIERGSDRALITDFGVSLGPGSDDQQLTQVGEVMGTARYMAPEQATDESSVDSRADIYSLGLVAYYMLKGTHAIKGRSFSAIIAAHVRGIDVRFGEIDRDLPQGLVEALDRCVAQKPNDRFQRIEDFVEALQGLGGNLKWDLRAPMHRETDAWSVTHIGKGKGAERDSSFVGAITRGVWTEPSSNARFEEDALGDRQRDASVAVVVEGGGGGDRCGEARRMTVLGLVQHVNRRFHAAYEREGTDPDVFLRLLADAASKYRASSSGLYGDGSDTLKAMSFTMFLGLWPHGYFLQMGNSRAYMFHEDVLTRISRDAPISGGLIERGLVTQVSSHGPESERSGTLEHPSSGPLVTRVLRDWGAWMLFCSGGLTRYVSDSQIAEHCRTAISARHLCERLLEDALHAGSEHDITVVVGRTLRPTHGRPVVQSYFDQLRSHVPV